MTPEELYAIEVRANAATPGPWTSITHPTLHHSHNDVFVENDDSDLICEMVDGKVFDRLATAEFIAHAREDIPALIAEIRRLRRQLILRIGD